jgi:hypothetical protein
VIRRGPGRPAGLSSLGHRGTLSVG